MKEMERKPLSIRWKMLILVLLIQVPFCLFFYIASNRTINQVNDHFAIEQQAALDSYREYLRDQLDEANAFLFIECWNNAELSKITQAENVQEEAEIIDPFLKDAKELILNNLNINTVTFYVPSLSTGWVVHNNGVFRETRYLDLIKDLSSLDTGINRGWNVVKAGNKTVIARVCEYDGVFTMASMSLDEIATDARIATKLSASVAVRQNGEFITNTVWNRGLSGAKVDPLADKSDWLIIRNPYTFANYQIVRTHFAGMELYMGTRYIYDWSWIKLLAYGLITVVFMTLVLGVLYLNRTYFSPLNNLVNTMEEITDGQGPSLDFPDDSKEFTSVSNIFKGMLKSLDEQKIATYENELKAQRMETSALRLQIRRHFFLNCLKNIYSLANLGDLESIKKIVLLLSVNMRYTLDFHKDAIDIKTELEKCHNYVELQGVGQEYPPAIETKIEPGLEDFLVPPVSVLTILENCCKYGYRHNVALKININVHKQEMDDESFVCIVIQDNGVGFKSEDLLKLNNNLAIMQAEGHVGLPNTIARFRMLHGENCEVLFSNRQGARVELIIPLKKEGSEEA